MRGFQKYERNRILTMAFWAPCKIAQPIQPIWNSIFSIFLESPHQVDMKNVVKSSKQFFGYFNTLETHSEILQLLYMFSESIELKIHLLVLIDYSFFLGSLLGSDRRSTLNRKVYTKGWIERPVWKPGSKGWIKRLNLFCTSLVNSITIKR